MRKIILLGMLAFISLSLKAQNVEHYYPIMIMEGTQRVMYIEYGKTVVLDSSVAIKQLVRMVLYNSKRDSLNRELLKLPNGFYFKNAKDKNKWIATKSKLDNLRY